MTLSPSDAWFKYIHTHFLIYNICWEDAAVDRKLLKLDESSSVFMISSAGENALTYLLDNPESIVTVDINKRQTALLELKMAILKESGYDDFFEFFGTGKSARYKEIYSRVRDDLTPPSRKFWDSNISYFSPDGKGLFYQGGSGYFARLMRYLIKTNGLTEQVDQLIHEPKRSERERLFTEVSKQLISGGSKFMWKLSAVLGLAGIPRSQKKAIGDLNAFIRDVFNNVFVRQQAQSNPYWNVYLKGTYAEEYLPDYLIKENLQHIVTQLDKIEFSTQPVHQYLSSSKKKFTHFVLLDHMDWLYGSDQNALKNEWKLILKRARPGAKILFRTAHSSLALIPGEIRNKIQFTEVDPEWVALNDRVGTYTGTYLGTVQ